MKQGAGEAGYPAWRLAPSPINEVGGVGTGMILIAPKRQSIFWILSDRIGERKSMPRFPHV